MDPWMENLRCFACGQMSHDRITDGRSAEDEGQTCRWSVGVLEIEYNGQFLAAVLCWPCFWSFEPDMWISGQSYMRRNPIVPLDNLPLLQDEDLNRFNPKIYEWPI